MNTRTVDRFLASIREKDARMILTPRRFSNQSWVSARWPRCCGKFMEIWLRPKGWQCQQCDRFRST